MATTMTVQCPSCDASFPVDPAKVPQGGARTQCTVCHTHFRVDSPEPEAGEDPGAGAAGTALTGADTPEVSYDWSGEAEPAFAPVGSDIEVIASGFGLEAPEESEEAEGATEDLEPAAEHLDVELEEALESGAAVAEPLQAMEAGEPGDGTTAASDDAGDDWGSGLELEEDWVLETESTAEFTDVEIEVERLDTVEEQLRHAQELPAEPEPGISHELGIEPDEDFVDFMSEGVAPPAEEAEESEVLAAETGDEAFEGLGREYEGEFIPGEPEDSDEGIEVADIEPDGAHAEVETEEPRAAVEPPLEQEAQVREAEPTGEVGEPESDTESPSEPSPSGGFQMGRRDPHEKARRLARVLVSDMITYNPDRYSLALQWGSLKQDFAEEISKSWAEYVEQVGQELAESTPYWSEALNEILAKGKPLF